MSRSGTQAFAMTGEAGVAVARAPGGVAWPRPRRSAPGRILLATALAGSAAFLILTAGGREVRPAGRLLAELDRALVAAGFTIAEVRLAGHRHTGDREIFDALAPYSGGSLLALDVARAQAAIEALPWIERAAIERILPDKLALTVTERTPAAVWIDGGRSVLVDRTGRVLAPVQADLAEALALVRVTGGGAAAAVGELLQALAAAPRIAERVTLAERVGGRRWTLHLTGGLTVHLAADRVGPSLERLAGLLARGIAGGTTGVVDLRLPDRVGIVPRAPVRGGAGKG